MEENKKLENDELEGVSGGRIIYKPRSGLTDRPGKDPVKDKLRLSDGDALYKSQPLHKP